MELSGITKASMEMANCWVYLRHSGMTHMRWRERELAPRCIHHLYNRASRLRNVWLA